MGKKNFAVKESRISHEDERHFTKKRKLVANLPMCAHVSPFLPTYLNHVSYLIKLNDNPYSLSLQLINTKRSSSSSSSTSTSTSTSTAATAAVTSIFDMNSMNTSVFDMSSMNIDFHETKMTRPTLLFSFFLFFHALLYSISINTGWLALCASVLPVAGVLLTAALLVVTARAMLMTWITVLVLLAFSGKRHRFLALQGRKITADVAMYVVKVVFRGKGLVALVCATFLSFLLIIAQ